MMAGVSIGQLFLAGVIPGIIMGATMMLTVAYYDLRVRKEAFDLEVLASSLASA